MCPTVADELLLPPTTENNFLALVTLKQFLDQAEANTQVTFTKSTWRGQSLEPSSPPLLIPCVAASRLETDVAAALSAIPGLLVALAVSCR